MIIESVNEKKRAYLKSTVTALKNPENWKGNTPLHYAAKRGHVKICWFILITVEDKNPRCRKGETPLHLAAKNGHFDVCQLMVKHVDNLYPVNDDCETPYSLAVDDSICNLISEHNALRGNSSYFEDTENEWETSDESTSESSESSME